MKIAITYPPIDSGKGVPLLSQNRQFQWFNSPTYIYPVVPASAATLLKKNGYDVLWSDGIATEKGYGEWLDELKREQPGVVVIETKTPVVKTHWKVIEDLKNNGCEGWNPVTVLMGDHVTALPQESMEKSLTDFVITGGDYDFLLLSICEHLSKGKELEAGIWYRNNGNIENTGAFVLKEDLNKLPFIDRDLTKWHLYSEKNGNYKRLPGTYTMAGRDCWYNKCTFCSWPTIYPSFRARKPENVLDEIGILIDKYGVREVMDDTGTFPVGEWLEEFCRGMISRGYNKKIFIDCNMRFGALSMEQYKLMKEAGFRLLLFGVESTNPKTLERVKKGITVDTIVSSCKDARRAGLYPHITIMFGYPWEERQDAVNTLNLGKWLMKKGYAWTMQATVVIPYPGTPLFEECKAEGWLTTTDWDRYDMREAVMKSPMSSEEATNLVQAIYSVAFGPEFLLRRFLAIRDLDDIKYFARAGGKVLGHIFDFKSGRHEC